MFIVSGKKKKDRESHFRSHNLYTHFNTNVIDCETGLHTLFELSVKIRKKNFLIEIQISRMKARNFIYRKQAIAVMKKRCLSKNTNRILKRPEMKTSVQYKKIGEKIFLGSVGVRAKLLFFFPRTAGFSIILSRFHERFNVVIL